MASTVALIGAAGVTRDIVLGELRRAGLTVADGHGPPRLDAEVVVAVDPTGPEWKRLGDTCASVVVVLDKRVSSTNIVDAFVDGASAVVTVHDEPEVFRRAIRLAAAGEVQLPRHLTRAVLERARARAESRPVQLTTRESQILAAIVAGTTLKQTARALGISEKTVQNLQTRLFRKLGATNRVHCVGRAHELNLVDTD